MGELATVGNCETRVPIWLDRLASEIERGRLDEFVAAMDSAVRQHVPSYAELPRAVALRLSLERTSVTYCRTLRERRPLADQERVALHLIGAQRARIGVAPEDMVSAVEAAVSAGWRFALATLRELGADAETVATVAGEAFPLTLAFADDVRSCLLMGYRADGEEPLPAQVSVNATVIDRLLAGGANDEDLFDAIRPYGVDVRPPCGLLIVTHPSRDATTPLRPGSTAIAATLPGVIEGPGRQATVPVHTILLATAVKDWPALVSAAGEVARSHGIVVVGIDRPAVRLVDLASMYQTVEALLPLARRAARGAGLVAYSTLALFRTLSAIPLEERIELVKDAIGPLLENRKGELYLEAYEAWLEAGYDTNRAGGMIGEPAHTVRYRVGMVEKLTGISAKSAEGRLRLDLSVLVWRAWVRGLLAGEDGQRP